MRAIPKSAKIHPAAKKCCGWEEPAIWQFLKVSNWEAFSALYMAGFSQPQHFFAAGCIFGDFGAMIMGTI